MKNGFKVIDIENIGEMVSLVAESDFLSREQKQALLYDNAHALGFGK